MDGLKPDARVRSTEYGTGTIESVGGSRIVVYWDKPMPDSMTHRLDHHRSFVETLELLDELAAPLLEPTSSTANSSPTRTTGPHR